MDARREQDPVPSKRRRGDDEKGNREEGIRGTEAAVRTSSVGKGQPGMGTNQETLASFISVVNIRREKRRANSTGIIGEKANMSEVNQKSTERESVQESIKGEGSRSEASRTDLT